ncbi:hypothetical protein [uncultured Microbacterium sp.]|uniref:hypothetical protein n=1 Tax=uncultured Microbacterium sp. TaxID=191216 RepID=UPI0025D4A16E|nr:hypothetical protein [uncultured Microbacterium sp.]
MTNLTPPPAPSSDPRIPAAAVRPPRRRATTAITTAAIIVGALSLAATGGGAAVAATGQISGSTTAASTTVDAAGARALTLDASAGAVTIRFADVTKATLRTEGVRGADWTLDRSGDTLRVRSADAPFGWWLGSWFSDGPRIALTLPRALQGALDADLTLDAGSLDARGDFRALTTTMSAGSLSVDASADSLTTRVDAGSANLRVRDAATADLQMSAGRITATLTGSAPDSVRLDVSAGSLDLTLPSGAYALTKDVSAGSLDTRIPTDPSSSHRIQADLSAGSITLRSGD